MSVPSLLSIFGNSGGEDPVYVDDVFSTFLYVGNNATGRNIVNGIDLSGEGGLAWVKKRSGANEDHVLLNTERGANKFLRSNSAAIEITSGGPITAFRSDGFTVDNNGYVNASNQDYVSWTFRKAPGFFDVVTYTGNDTNGRTVAHNLGSVPGMIIIKGTNDTYGWHVYHRELGSGKYVLLNSDNGSVTNAYAFGATPTSTHFTIGANWGTNRDGYNFVAYLFAHDEAVFGTGGDESIIKCGSFTSSNTWGNFKVDLGFEPQFVMYKRTSDPYNASDWHMLDSMRGIVGPGDIALEDTPEFFSAVQVSDDAELRANTTDDEVIQGRASLYSQGFLGNIGQGNKEYIYMAIRRPNKPPETATEVFGLSTQSGSPYPSFTSGFPVDFYIKRDGMSNAGNDNNFASRLMGKIQLKSNTMGEEVGYPGIGWDYMTGFAEESNTVSGNYAYMFKRAPSFVDVITYYGNGSVRDINHNLGVIPELIITKSISNTQGWGVSSSLFANPTGDFLYLNASDAISNFSNNLFKTATNTTYGYGTASPNDGRFNRSDYRYVTYLFATLSGISKVSTYSGTGNAINVDCGFTNGARFILIKRTNASGKWYVWDTLRGISSGNDPYFTLNQDAAQVTNQNYVGPLAAGFTVTSSAPAAINASGSTYLFLAIA